MTKINSQEWINQFAERLGYTYDEMMFAAKNYLKNGSYLRGGGELEGEHVPEEFWVHYRNVTGEEVDENDEGNFFSCAC